MRLGSTRALTSALRRGGVSRIHDEVLQHLRDQALAASFLIMLITSR